MSMELKINDDKFSAAMQRFVSELGMSAPEVFKTQMRLFLKDLQENTWPKSAPQGKARLVADINKAVAPLSGSWTGLKDGRLKTRLRQVTSGSKKDLTALRAILSNMGGRFASARVEEFSPSLHTNQRDPRTGRVKARSRVYTPDTAAYRHYVNLMKGFVGWARGGWNAGAKHLGEARAVWYSHFTRGGTSSGNPGTRFDPNIRMENRAVKIPGYGRTVEFVLRLREKKMTLSLQHTLNRLARQAGLDSNI